MSNWPFRFVHASDFHLEQPLSGVAEVPEHLRELFLEAPYAAAARVFETALTEQAAFLILSGDILHPLYAGPRGMMFLCEQFARLAEREIAVYWAGGTVDPPDQWPASIALPGNVHVFPRGRVDEFVHEHDGAPIARLLGTSRRQTTRHPSRRFSCPIRAGCRPSPWLTAARTRRPCKPGVFITGPWAAGTIAQRRPASPHMIHYCGSPQGRRPEESGVHGCTLVQVDEKRQIRTSLDSHRRRALAQRADRGRQGNDPSRPGNAISRTNPLAARIGGEFAFADNLDDCRQRAAGRAIAVAARLAADLLDRLRADYGFSSPSAWSLSIEVEPADRFAGGVVRAGNHSRRLSPRNPPPADEFRRALGIGGVYFRSPSSRIAGGDCAFWPIKTPAAAC